MTPPNKKPSSFSFLGDVLKEQLAKMSGHSVAPMISLKNSWSGIVGATIAAQSEVLYIKNKVLHVSVKSSAWHQELTFMKLQIKSKVRDLLKDESVEDVRFRVG